MKIIINTCFGGFGISEEAEKTLGFKSHEAEAHRTDKAFIELVENDSEAVSARYSELEVVSIPDETTDWEISEYDGNETVIYVVDGQIHHMF